MAEAKKEKTVAVLCIRSRLIADDKYVAGEKYKIAVSRYEKYSEYFLDPKRDPKRAQAYAKYLAELSAEPEDDPAGLTTKSGL